MKCARSSCGNDGTNSFDGRPDVYYCRGCFEYLRLKLARIDSEMSRIRAERRAEAEDNRPARQPASIQ